MTVRHAPPTRTSSVQAGTRDLHGEGWSSCFDCLEEALAEGAVD
jgi:hypothetical protein